jgi:polar amino acid transport system substrate-binding protein
MRLTIALIALLLIRFGEARADDAAVKDVIAGFGTLFIGVVVEPVPGPGNVARIEGAGRGLTDPAGFKGVEVDLGMALAQKLGVEAAFLSHENSQSLIRSFRAGEFNVAFVRVNEVREEEYLRFGSAYIVLRSTYLVGPGSRIKRLADMDKRGVRVASIETTAAARDAARSLKRATVTNVKTTDEALELLRSRRADAVALSREAAVVSSVKLPGSRVLDGAFSTSHVAIAVSKEASRTALAYLSAFIDEAIVSGSVRRALDKAGMQKSVVPPPRTSPR